MVMPRSSSSALESIDVPSGDTGLFENGISKRGLPVVSIAIIAILRI